MNITEKQGLQFNYMLATLIKISKEYQTPEQLRKNSHKHFGLGYEEALEMAYENLQEEAASACKGVRHIGIKIETTPQNTIPYVPPDPRS